MKLLSDLEVVSHLAEELLEDGCGLHRTAEAG